MIDTDIDRCAPGNENLLRGWEGTCHVGKMPGNSLSTEQMGKQGRTEEFGLDPIGIGELCKIFKQNGDGHICVLNNSLLTDSTLK